MPSERDNVVFCFRFVVVVLILYINLEALVEVDGQLASTMTVLSTSTIPTCVSIYGPNTANTQRLCGAGQDEEVTTVRLNINIGASSSGANTLVFTAFPYQNTTVPGSAPANPCDNVPFGQNCTALQEPIYVTWKTFPIAAAYTLRPIAPNVPIAYIAYKAPYVAGDDDQTLGWYESNGECYFDDGQQKTTCPFMAEGAFERNKYADICSNIDITVQPTKCTNDVTGSNCQYSCGTYQVEHFLQCGGFPTECGGVDPQTQAANGYQCSCFPFNVGSDHAKELKQAGMHTTNAILYLDNGCGMMSSGLLSPPNPDTGNEVGGIGGGPMNYPNSAQAACRHMAYIIKTGNNSLSQKFLSNNEPFIKVDPQSICSVYSYGGTQSELGCGFPWDTNSAACGGDSGNCYYQYGDTPRWNYFNDYTRCIGNETSTAIPLDDTSCRTGTQRTTGRACVLPNRWGPLWPLSGLYVADYEKQYQEIGQFTSGAVPCVTCRYDHMDSSFFPGLGGNQRKGKFLIDDFRESWVAAYSVGTFDPDPSNSVGGLNPINGTLGFNYYQIKNQVKGTTQTYILSPLFVSQVLQSCSPSLNGETCYGSFNQPVDFFVSGSSDPSQIPNIYTQGIEGFVQIGNGRGGLQYTKRGSATTPFYGSPGDDKTDHGHHVKCGFGCDPSYQASISTTFSGNALSQNVSQIGVAKGIAQLDPQCTAMAVSLQGKIFTGVEFTFNFINSSGQNDTRVMVLTTENIGSGNSVQYLDVGNGVVGRINNELSPTDQSPPEIGGVIVICGTTSVPGVGIGSLWGQFSPDPQSFVNNPWGLLTQFIQKMEDDGYFPGITGYKKGGCPVPVPSFVTAMQCFSIQTACSAPHDLCQAISEMCSSGAFDCVANNMKPVGVQYSTGGSSYIVTDYDNPSNTQTCTIPKVNDAKAVSWYWLPTDMINAFGTKCGQYGMDTYTFGKDTATQQFMCQQPFSQNSGVPCVPGVSENINVPSPCQVMGDLVNFHGQTSDYAATTYGPPRSAKRGVCLSTAQTNFIDNDFNGQSGGYSGGCSNLGDGTGFTNFSQKAFKPANGLPPRWQITNPQYWVSNGYLMSSDTLLSAITLDVTLEISGFGLNALVVNVDGGRFVDSGFACQLEQNSQGNVNISMQNTGASTSDYTIVIDNCTDPSNLLTNPVSLGNTNTQISVDGVNAGEVRSTNIPINMDALGKVQSLICNFHLSPKAIPTMTLSTMAINCNVDGFLQTASIGETGIDNAQVGDPDNIGDTGCGDSTEGFGCWLINGGLLSKILLGTILLMAMAAGIAISITLAKYNFYTDEGISTSQRYDELVVKNEEIERTEEEKMEAQRLKAEQQIRQQSLKENLPGVADAFAEALQRHPLVLPET